MTGPEQRPSAPSASALHGEGAKAVAAEILGLTPPGAADRTGRVGVRPARVVALVVSVSLVVGAAIFLAKFINGPVSAGAIAATASPGIRVQAKIGTSQLAGIYFEMAYPASYDQVSHQNNDRQALEQYYLSSRGDSRKLVAVAVRPLTSNLLDDDASYKLRKIHPDDYKLREDKLNGETAAVMTKVDNTEVTLFWLHKGKILTISMTTSNPADDLAGEMKAAEKTLRWRQ